MPRRDVTLTDKIAILEQINQKFWEELIAYFSWYDMDRIENDVSNNSIAACVFITVVTFLQSSCLATIGGFLPNQAVT
jgi:hypothetical protein